MIQKIRSDEYLKRIDNMSASEKEVFLNRVGEWLREQAPLLIAKGEYDGARYQNVIQCSAGWNDAECKAWTEGVRLLSALAPVVDTWLPDMLYSKSAKRCIGKMTSILSAPAGDVSASPQPSAISHQPSVITPQPSAITPQPSSITAPVRPKHIDQYVHLLPKKTQERAAKYGPLMREMDEVRRKEQMLMDAGDVSSSKHEAMAKHIVAIDTQIKNIKKELDAEWDKLAKSGRVGVDALGNAYVKDIDHSPSAAELTSEQKARRRELRKWLTDTRRGREGQAREERIIKWRENWKEYLTLEPREKALADQKIMEAAVFYGIDIYS